MVLKVSLCFHEEALALKLGDNANGSAGERDAMAY